MSITYVRSRPACSERFEEYAANKDILFFDPVAEESDDIGDQYRNLAAGIRACDAVIVRGSDDDLLAALEDAPRFDRAAR